MFKASFPLEKVQNFDGWFNFMDRITGLVKNDQVLEKYIEIMELCGEEAMNALTSGLNEPNVGNINILSNLRSDMKVIIEGSKDHKSMTFSMEGKTANGDKMVLDYFILDQDELKFTSQIT